MGQSQLGGGLIAIISSLIFPIMNISSVWSLLHYKPARPVLVSVKLRGKTETPSLSFSPTFLLSWVVINGPHFHANPPNKSFEQPEKCNPPPPDWTGVGVHKTIGRAVQILLTPLGSSQCEGNFIPGFIFGFYSHHSGIVGTSSTRVLRDEEKKQI